MLNLSYTLETSESKQLKSKKIKFSFSSINNSVRLGLGRAEPTNSRLKSGPAVLGSGRLTVDLSEEQLCSSQAD